MPTSYPGVLIEPLDGRSGRSENHPDTKAANDFCVCEMREDFDEEYHAISAVQLNFALRCKKLTSKDLGHLLQDDWRNQVIARFDRWSFHCTRCFACADQQNGKPAGNGGVWEQVLVQCGFLASWFSA